jgi:hypothetical protein
VNWEIELSPDAAEWFRKLIPKPPDVSVPHFEQSQPSTAPGTGVQPSLEPYPVCGGIESAIIELCVIFKTHAWSFW